MLVCLVENLNRLQGSSVQVAELLSNLNSSFLDLVNLIVVPQVRQDKGCHQSEKGHLYQTVHFDHLSYPLPEVSLFKLSNDSKRVESGDLVHQLAAQRGQLGHEV